MTNTLPASHDKLTIHWGIQVLLWIIYWVYSAVQTLPFYDNLLQNFVTQGIFALCSIICVYINLLFLIPKFLIPK
ncbi:MAG: hypothetical protein AAF694_30170, partial [Bacteroidota bacterium]